MDSMSRQRRRASAVCHGSWPDELWGRAYVGRRAPDGSWRLEVRTAQRGTAATLVVAGPGIRRRLARAMLRDALGGRRVRDDLVDAFASAWPLPAREFRLAADLVAGWAVKWALERDA
jgi:hypothetical protein